MKIKRFLSVLASIAVLVALGACKGSNETSEDRPDRKATASIKIGFNKNANKLSPKFATTVIGTIADVTSITADVQNAYGYLVRGVQLTNNGGTWSATINDLPVGEQLTFTAHAFNSSLEEIFTGNTSQILSGVNDVVNIFMSPAMNGATLQIPRIIQISRPSEILISSTAPISISIEGSSGETLSYEITPAQNGGVFSPSSGSIGLNGTSATIVFSYTAPDATGTYIHSVKVTNSLGNSVETAFETNIASQLTGSDVFVQFNPVITALNSRRSGSDVTFAASVSDADPSSLTYNWSFDGGLSFADPAANPAVMLGYDESVSGMLTLTVTNAIGGSTSVLYPINPGQFPNSLVTNVLLLPQNAIWTAINDCRFGAVSGNVVTLAMEETWENDYNGDGDYNDRVLGYVDVTNNNIVNTGIAIKDSVAIEGDIMAFEFADTGTIGWYSISSQTSHDTGITADPYTFGREYEGPSRLVSNGRIAYIATTRDLNGDEIPDPELNLYEIAHNNNTPTGAMVGYDNWRIAVPSINGDLVAFTGPASTIEYYNVLTGLTINTGIPGAYPTIDNGIIVFDTPSGQVAYYNISNSKYVVTPLPVNNNSNASISNGIIAAAVEEGGIWGDLNGDGVIGTSGNGILVLYDIATGRMISTGVRICCGPEISGFVIALDDRPSCTHWYVVIDEVARRYFGR